jgi:putative thioredoxin
LLFFEDPAKANDLIRDGNFEKQYLELAESLQLLTELLTQLEAQERLPESPMKELYIEAIDAVSKQNFAAALDKAIEIIRTDRYYMDDAARKLCIAIFKYLGEEHPLAGEYRRPFGSALYV